MKKVGKEEKVFQSVAHTVMSILSILAVLPFWLLFASSITDENVVIKNGYNFIPKVFSFDAYSYLAEQWMQIGRAYGITILVTSIGTAAAILFVIMFAYGLSQKDVPGVKVIFILVILTMLFNGGIVPTYYVYTNVVNVKNTIWGLIIPYLLMNGFTVILVKNYVGHNIPDSLIEAAEIDGANQFQIMFKLIIPLSKPILATVGVMTGVMYWNNWTNGLYFITEPKLFSIQQLLNKMNDNIMFLANNAANLGGINLSSIPSATIRMAIAVVAVLPIMIIYPFFQKFFAKGIVLGAVKG